MKRLLWRLDKWGGRGSYPSVKRWLDPAREWSEWTYASVLAESLGPELRWLDAGCGHQVLKLPAKAGGNVLPGRVRFAAGCDGDFASLRKHESIRNVLCCMLDDLPFAAGAFDVITLNYVAEHLANPQRVFAECARVLAPGGLLIIHTPNVAGYIMRLVRVGQAILPRGLILRAIRYMEYREPEDVFPTYYRANTRQTLGRLLGPLRLGENRVELLPERPLFYFIPPLAAFELILSKWLIRIGWANLGATTILAVYRKSSL